MEICMQSKYALANRFISLIEGHNLNQLNFKDHNTVIKFTK